MTSGSDGYRTTFKFGVDDYGSWMTRQIAVKDKSGKLTGAKVSVKGSLQSWHYSGRLVNVQNQKVVVQVRKPHELNYATKSTATTSRTGTFATTLTTAGLKGYDVRIAFVSGIPMTASSFTYLGKLA